MGLIGKKTWGSIIIVISLPRKNQSAADRVIFKLARIVNLWRNDGFILVKAVVVGTLMCTLIQSHIM
jgi:hypothetical protein